MNSVLVVVFLGAVAILFLVAKNFFAPSTFKVKLNDVPLVFEKLRETGKNASFAAFCFGPPRETSPKQTVNIQFSIENDRIGLDWVLLAPANIQDRNLFLELAKGRGYQAVEREMNNVKYLRVENGNLPALCQAVMRELYSVSDDNELILIRQGFAWP